MVYDCGSLSLKSSLLEKRVRSDFENDMDVDILFISHFDNDHINGVRLLNPKIVVLPLLSDTQIRILKLYNRVVPGSYDVALAEDPRSVFPGARIIWVLAEEGDMDNRRNDEALTIDVSDVGRHTTQTTRIKSRQSIVVSDGGPIWEYIPLNPNWDRFTKSFISEIGNEGLEWDKLGDLYNAAYVKAHMDALKRVYTRLRYKNKHSLVVYSNALCGKGMVEGFGNFRRDMCVCCMSDFHPSGCIYFGDITVDDSWIGPYYAFLTSTGRLPHVGAVQIPHHGSYLSHGDRIFQSGFPVNRPMLCVISVGESNRFGHPSLRMVAKLHRSGGIVMMVTEAVTSSFICHGRF